jgi:hypothetical protein
MRLTLEGPGEYGELPEGRIFNAEISSVKEVEKPWIDDRTGEKARRLAFEFTITDEDFKGRKAWEDLFTSFYVSDRCKLYVWTLKILDRDELPEGFTLDTSAFEGARVNIRLGTRNFTRKDGTPGSTQEVELLSATEANSMRAATATAPQPLADVGTAPSQAVGYDLTEEPF